MCTRMALWLNKYSSVRLPSLMADVSLARSCSTSKSSRFMLDRANSLKMLRKRLLLLQGTLAQSNVEVALGKLTALSAEVEKEKNFEFLQSEIVLLLYDEVERLKSPFIYIRFACALQRLGISGTTAAERLSKISAEDLEGYGIDVLFALVDLICRAKLSNSNLLGVLLETICSRMDSDWQPVHVAALARIVGSIGDVSLCNRVAAFLGGHLLEGESEHLLETDVLYLTTLAELNFLAENHVNAVCARYSPFSDKRPSVLVLYAKIFHFVLRHQQLLKLPRTCQYARSLLAALLLLPDWLTPTVSSAIIACHLGYQFLGEDRLFVHFLKYLKSSKQFSALSDDQFVDFFVCIPQRVLIYSNAEKMMIDEITMRAPNLTFAQVVHVLETISHHSGEIPILHSVEALLARWAESEALSQEAFTRVVTAVWRLSLSGHAVKLPSHIIVLHLKNSLSHSTDTNTVTLSTVLKACSLSACPTVGVVFNIEKLERAVERNFRSLQSTDLLAVLRLSVCGGLNSLGLLLDAYHQYLESLPFVRDFDQFSYLAQCLARGGLWTEVFEVCDLAGAIFLKAAEAQTSHKAISLPWPCKKTWTISNATQGLFLETLINKPFCLHSFWMPIIELNIYSQEFFCGLRALLLACPSQVWKKMVHYSWAAYWPHPPADVEVILLSCLSQVDHDNYEVKALHMSSEFEQVEYLWSVGVAGWLDKVAVWGTLNGLLENLPSDAPLRVQRHAYDIRLYMQLHCQQDVQNMLGSSDNDALLPDLKVDPGKWKPLLEDIFLTGQAEVQYNTYSADGLFLPVSVKNGLINESLLEDLINCGTLADPAPKLFVDSRSDLRINDKCSNNETIGSRHDQGGCKADCIYVDQLVLLQVPDCLCLRTPEQMFELFTPELRFRLQLYKKAGWHPVMIHSDPWEKLDDNRLKQRILMDILGMASTLSVGK